MMVVWGVNVCLFIREWYLCVLGFSWFFQAQLFARVEGPKGLMRLPRLVW